MHFRSAAIAAAFLAISLAAPAQADWLEAKTLDTCIKVDASLDPEADAVFKQIKSVSLNWDQPNPGETLKAYVRQGDTNLTWVLPDEPEYRYPTTRTDSLWTLYYGLGYLTPFQSKFFQMVAHEGRHAWQGQLTQISTGTIFDNDGDYVYSGSVPVSSPELRDAHYVEFVTSGTDANPETDFQGDVDASTRDAYPIVRPVQERNAIRFAGRTTGQLQACPGLSIDGLQMARTDASRISVSARMNMSPPASWGVQQPSTGPVMGALIIAESNSTCAAEGWATAGYGFTDDGGNLSLVVSVDAGKSVRLRTAPFLGCQGATSVCSTP